MDYIAAPSLHPPMGLATAGSQCKCGMRQACSVSKGRTLWFEGNFQDNEADKMRRLGTDSVVPHRLKYKKFTR